MSNQPTSPNNVLDNFILLSSESNSLSAHNGSEEIVNNNVAPQAPTMLVGMGKGLFSQINQKKNQPRDLIAR